MSAPQTLTDAISCLSDYDPNALPVARARDIIDRVVVPVEAVERVALRSALGRVLAENIASPFDVPASDNSAMDGYAVRAADLIPDAPTTPGSPAPHSPGGPSTVLPAPAKRSASPPAPLCLRASTPS